MEAVYQLLDIDRGVPEVMATEFDIRVLLDAMYELNDRKDLKTLAEQNKIQQVALHVLEKKRYVCRRTLEATSIIIIVCGKC